MNVFSLRTEGKVVILTGGYGQLGSAIAESLAFHGAQVIVAAKSNEKFDIAFHGNANISFLQTDIADAASIENCYTAVFEKQGRIDVVINNAFYSKGQSPELITDEEWSFGIDGILNSVFRSIRAVIPFFKKQGFGKIINVSSMYGIVSPDFTIYETSPEFLNPPHYGAAKAGVLQLTRYYAAYLGKSNIQVNAVTPGPFPSESVQENKTFIKSLQDRTCLNTIGKPEDLAGIFTFLASDAANFVTGQNFIIDGGWTVK